MINLHLVRSMIRQADGDTEMVSIPRTVFRGVLMDLMILLETQKTMDAKKIELVRGLTLQFACMNIAEMLKEIGQTPDMSLEQGITFAIKMVRDVGSEAEAGVMRISGTA